MAQSSYRVRSAPVTAIQVPATAGGVVYGLSMSKTTNNGIPVVSVAAPGDWLVLDQNGAMSVMTSAAFALAYEASPGIGSDSSGV